MKQNNLVVVENYRHAADRDGYRPFVYRIFSTLELALVYVETDLRYLFTTFYSDIKIDVDTNGVYLDRPLRVFSNPDNIEYWTLKGRGGSLDYLRNRIKLNVELWDNYKSHKIIVTPESAKKQYEYELERLF